MTRSRQRPRLLDLLALAWYVALTTIFLWPIISGVDSVLPHSVRDPGFQATVLHDVSMRLQSLDLTHLFDGSFFYPARLTLAMADAQVGLQVLALPLHLAGADALLIVNLLTILSFPVTAVSADALGRYVTRSRVGGLLVGTVFAFAPFRMEHVIHLQLLQSWTIALAYLGAEMTLRERSRRGVALWAFALVAAAATSLNYLLILAITQPVYLAMRLLLAPQRRASLTRLLRVVPVAIGAAVVIALLALPYLMLKGEGYSRSATSTFPFSARLLDYAVPAADSILLRPLFDLLGPASGPDERELLPGLLITALALGGLIAQVARREWHRLRRYLPWLVTAGVAYLFSLGPYLGRTPPSRRPASPA